MSVLGGQTIRRETCLINCCLTHQYLEAYISDIILFNAPFSTNLCRFVIYFHHEPSVGYFQSPSQCHSYLRLRASKIDIILYYIVFSIFTIVFIYHF